MTSWWLGRGPRRLQWLMMALCVGLVGWEIWLLVAFSDRPLWSWIIGVGCTGFVIGCVWFHWRVTTDAPTRARLALWARRWSR